MDPADATLQDMLHLRLDERHTIAPSMLASIGISVVQSSIRVTRQNLFQRMFPADSRAENVPQLPVSNAPIELIESIAQTITEELEEVERVSKAQSVDTPGGSASTEQDAEAAATSTDKSNGEQDIQKPLQRQRRGRAATESSDLDGVSLWESEEERRARIQAKRAQAGKNDDDMVFWSPPPQKKNPPRHVPAEKGLDTTEEKQFPYLAALEREQQRYDLAYDDGEIEESLATPNDEVAEYTVIEPGSDKVDLLARRYAAGLPLHNDRDRKDHGPRNENNKKKSGAKFGGYHHNNRE